MDRKGDWMGFWYLLILLLGLVVFIVGVIQIKTRRGLTRFIPLVMGGGLIAISIFLLSPNSSKIIEEILNL